MAGSTALRNQGCFGGKSQPIVLWAFVSLDVSCLQLEDFSDEPRAKEYEEIVHRLGCRFRGVRGVSCVEFRGQEFHGSFVDRSFVEVSWKFRGQEVSWTKFREVSWTEVSWTDGTRTLWKQIHAKVRM